MAERKTRLLGEINQGEVSMFSLDWEGVQGKVKDLWGAELPEEIVDALGMSSLSWKQIQVEGGNASLLIGVKEDIGEVVECINKAEATVLLLPEFSVEDEPSRLKSLELAGVTLDSNGSKRAIGAEYSAFGQLRVLAVSMSKKEASTTLEGLERGPKPLIAKIPPDLEKIDSLPGVITDGMIERTDSHEKVILVETILGPEEAALGLRLVDEEGAKSSLGFALLRLDPWFEKSGERTCTLRFSPEEYIEDYNASAWKREMESWSLDWLAIIPSE